VGQINQLAETEISGGPSDQGFVGFKWTLSKSRMTSDAFISSLSETFSGGLLAACHGQPAEVDNASVFGPRLYENKGLRNGKHTRSESLVASIESLEKSRNPDEKRFRPP
jgi:hypothetical protein